MKLFRRKPITWNPDGECDGPVEIWHVRDFANKKTPAFAPYFIARCECNWVGAAHDDTDPEAEQKVRNEAAVHCSNIKPEVAFPVD